MANLGAIGMAAGDADTAATHVSGTPLIVETPSGVVACVGLFLPTPVIPPAPFQKSASGLSYSPAAASLAQI